MIRLENVTKTFKLYRNPTDRLAEWLHLGKRHELFHALRDINLDVPPGRTTGIIGVNGAGKSTLLKLIAGTLLPTRGRISIDDRVAALLELGTGFHPDFTGLQNIYINGQLLGLTREQIAAVEHEIIDFSELGPFIHQPIRTYSSGMVMRLGFSIAASVNPDVLIVDEALSVGDARFSQKCIHRIRQFRDQGTTILFVSHDPGAVASLCDEAILLEAGQIRSRGLPRDMLDEYNALLASKGSGNMEMRIARPAAGAQSGPRRHGTFEALIAEMQTLREDGTPTDVFTPGDTMRIRIRVLFLVEVQNPTVGFVIKDRLGMSLYGTNTALQEIDLGHCRPGEFAEVEVSLPMQFNYGDYHITVAVHQAETHLDKCYEWVDSGTVFHVRLDDKPDWSGVVMLESTVETRNGTADPKEIEESMIDRFGLLPADIPPAFGPPAPFFSGFDPLSHDPHGERRVLHPPGVFVCRSAGGALRVRLGLPEESAAMLPLTWRLRFLSLDGQEPVHAAQQERNETLEFTLPESLAGRTLLLSLDCADEGPRPPRLSFYGVHTATSQEPTGWRDKTATRSSTT